MLTLVFVLFWVLTGLLVLFLALRGGPRGAREALHSQTRTGARANLALIAALSLFGIGVPAAVIIDNEESAKAGTSEIALTADEKEGRELFSQACSQCHVLGAADAVGLQGPSLDALRPPKALVVDAVVNGRVRGNGTMPAKLLNKEEAEHVGAFIAKVAGRN